MNIRYWKSYLWKNTKEYKQAPQVYTNSSIWKTKQQLSYFQAIRQVESYLLVKAWTNQAFAGFINLLSCLENHRCKNDNFTDTRYILLTTSTASYPTNKWIGEQVKSAYKNFLKLTVLISKVISSKALAHKWSLFIWPVIMGLNCKNCLSMWWREVVHIWSSRYFAAEGTSCSLLPLFYISR